MSEATTLDRRFPIKVKDGREWNLKRPTLAVEREYATYLEKRALEAINRQRVALGPVGYQETLRQHIANCVGNHYGWLRQGFVDSIVDAENVAHLLWSWIAANHKAEGDPLFVAGQREMYDLYLGNKEAFDAAVNDALNDGSPFLRPES